MRRCGIQRDTSLGQLDALIRRGRQIRTRGSVDATRAWQQDCAAAINQLSGGSKAHWLARAYSGRVSRARGRRRRWSSRRTATEIVDRILDVLAQGAASLSRMDDVEAASSGAAPRPRRFEFVHNAELRPVLERAFDDSRDALERGEIPALALILSCGVIEARAHRCARAIRNRRSAIRKPRSASAMTCASPTGHCAVSARLNRGADSQRLRPPAGAGADLPRAHRCRRPAARRTCRCPSATRASPRRCSTSSCGI